MGHYLLQNREKNKAESALNTKQRENLKERAKNKEAQKDHEHGDCLKRQTHLLNFHCLLKTEEFLCFNKCFKTILNNLYMLFWFYCNFKSKKTCKPILLHVWLLNFDS